MGNRNIPDEIPICSLSRSRSRRNFGFGPPVLEGTTGELRVELMQAFLAGGSFWFAMRTTTFVIATVDKDGESIALSPLVSTVMQMQVIYNSGWPYNKHMMIMATMLNPIPRAMARCFLSKSLALCEV